MYPVGIWALIPSEENEEEEESSAGEDIDEFIRPVG